MELYYTDKGYTLLQPDFERPCTFTDETGTTYNFAGFVFEEYPFYSLRWHYRDGYSDFIFPSKIYTNKRDAIAAANIVFHSQEDENNANVSVLECVVCDQDIDYQVVHEIGNIR